MRPRLPYWVAVYRHVQRNAAYLDGHSGEISWDLAASAQRWALVRQGPEPS